MNNPFYYDVRLMRLPQLEDDGGVLSLEAMRACTEELQHNGEGKMFGILVVETDKTQPQQSRNTAAACADDPLLYHQDGMDFLLAYSGQISGRSDWAGFVPAVFDYLQPDGYFKTHEDEITAINHEIERLENSEDYARARKHIAIIAERHAEELSDKREEIKKAKAEAGRKPIGGVAGSDDNIGPTHYQDTDSAYRIRLSQFLNAELRRLKQRQKAEREEAEAVLKGFDDRMLSLKHQRQQRSDALQRWLFSHFVMLNGRGESKDLLEIFSEYNGTIPPAGSGECCEPKLLQYAFAHGMRPKVLAMFWWGPSPQGEVRHHLEFYPACQAKCKPILAWMLQGVDVESNALELSDSREPEIIYEADDFVVVSKPAGMLSVPGKSSRESVESFIRRRYPSAKGPLIVHRLDMATSGLMLVALTKEAHERLQRLFLEHKVRKEYRAIVEAPTAEEAQRLMSQRPMGKIDLPLRPDLNDRPRQMVDHEYGKPALTSYRVLGVDEREVSLALYPLTGRTHQLRMHCAHPQGLGMPIKGDELYGHKADRLYLQAVRIEINGDRRYEFKIKAEF